LGFSSTVAHPVVPITINSNTARHRTSSLGMTFSLSDDNVPGNQR
jgi:hypothetical protein